MNIETTSHITNVNNVDVYYEQYLNPHANETLILVHGFLSSTFSFRRLIPLLNKDLNVLAIDLPPFGKSGKAKKYRYSYENIAMTLLRLLEKLGHHQVYAVGHSMGGQIILNMMHQRPDFIKKGILLCSSGYFPRAKNSLIFLSYLPFIDKYIKHHLEKTGVLGNLKLVVYDKEIIDEEMIDGYTQPFNHPEIFQALAKMLRDREGDLEAEKLQTINTPCLLIWGENDQVVPLHIGNRLAKDLPHSTFLMFKETGHLLPEEKPLDVYEAIQHFIYEN